MAIFNKRTSITKAQLLSHYSKRNSIADYLYGVFRIIAITIQNLYCISSYLVLSWIVLLPTGWLRSDLYSKAENYLYNSLLFIVSSWSLAAGTTVIESGEEYKQLIEGPEAYVYPIDKSPKLTNTTEEKGDRREPEKIEDAERRLEVVENTQQRSRPINGTSCPETMVKHVITKSNSRQQCSNNHDELTANQATGTDHVLVTKSNLRPRFKNGMNGFTTNCDNMQSGDMMPTDTLIKHVVASNGQIRRPHTRTVESEILISNNNNIENHHVLNNCTAEKQQQTKINGYKNNYQVSTTNNSLKPVTQNNGITAERATRIIRNGLSLTTKTTKEKPRILFLCNHISTADVPLIMQSFSTLTNQSLLWVLDAQFKYTNFGVVCSSHGDFFVAKNAYVDGSLREQVLRHPDRNVLVLFPEGGFLRKRIAGSNRYAIRNGLPLTKYVTHPRFGAFKDLIEPSVGVTHIVDATILYDDINNPLSILDIVLGNRKEPAIFNYKVYKRSDINPTEEWLRNLWLEKDKLLTSYYEDRASVLKQIEKTLRIVQLDWFKLLSVHLFYLLVCYLAIFRLFNATKVTMLEARELYYSNI